MTEPTPPNQPGVPPTSDQPGVDQPAFVPPLAAGASYQPPSMPDITDLVEGSKGRKDAPASAPGLGRNVIIGAVVGAVVVAGAGFLVGRATASGPKTLADALTQAQNGTLPCGDSGGPGAGGLITRLCGTGTGNGGFPGGGFPGGGGATGQNGPGGGFGGRGVVGTVTAVSATSITVNTRGGSVTVAVPSTVAVSKTVSGSMSDVTVGADVTVTSTTDASGARTATRITLVPAGTLPGAPGDGGAPAPQPSSS
jgi:hypothetical protein